MQFVIGSTFQNIGPFLKQIGFFDLILPFVLVFAIVYAVTKTVPIFSADKRLRIVVALSLAFLFIYPSLAGVPETSDPVKIIQKAVPELSVLAIAIIMALILIGVLGKSIGKVVMGIIAFISLGAVVWSFGTAAGIFQAWPLFNFLADPDLQALLVIVLVFGLIVWFITSDQTGGGGGLGKKVKDFLAELTD